MGGRALEVMLLARQQRGQVLAQVGGGVVELQVGLGELLRGVGRPAARPARRSQRPAK